jgi:methanogenic corrinoid protein MtbC1
MTRTLGPAGMQRFLELQPEAVRAVTERFYATHGSAYERFGPRGRAACREDLNFHLEFLRGVFECGLLQPMVDYLCWLDGVLAARTVPTEHLAQSLEWLAEYYTEHMDGEDGESVAQTLRDARGQFLAAGPSAHESSPPRAPDPWPEAAAFEAALLTGDRPQALAILKACLDAGRSLVDAELHVVQPSLYRIGEKWQANQVSVAQEHLATAIAQAVMTACLLSVRPPRRLGKKALLACVEGNHHAVGLQMVADALQLAGWQVQYLGANTPTASLVQQAIDWQPDLLGLSVSFPQQLRMVRTVMAELDARLLGGKRPAVIVGGLAINRFSQLAGIVGADGTAGDARTAAVLANEVVKAHAA